jgi:hypothetical protein
MSRRKPGRSRCNRPLWTSLLVLALACGGDGVTNPVEVPYGETTMVYLLNPVVNAVNAVTMPAPGAARSGVVVAIADGPSGTTGASGDLVLGPLSAGTKTVSFSGSGDSGQLDLAIAPGDLREIAVALDGSGASVMANLQYAFGGEVVEITPAMSVQQVNAALARSNLIVFLRSGTYAGDLEFSGSSVTLFGEGSQGGSVTIEGNVVVSGSGNRLRGARITGDLSIPGSDAGISHSRVAGTVTVDGSGAVLLNNAFCDAAAISGSGLLALGNAGLEPLPAPPAGC